MYPRGPQRRCIGQHVTTMPSPPIQPGDELIMTIAPRQRAGLVARVYAGCTAMLALPAALFARTWWALAIVVPVIVLFGAIAVRHVRELTHRTVLTSSQLIAPAPWRGWAVIDLTDVVSVAMQYEGDHETGVEWLLRIETADGRAVSLPVDEHPRLLGRASPGGPAAVIAAQVMAVQGPDGPFERSAALS
jgi:hypothetical protein